MKRLEKWSWVAGIIAAIVGVLAWLVDRNDFTAFCKNAWKTLLSPFKSFYTWLTGSVSASCPHQGEEAIGEAA